MIIVIADDITGAAEIGGIALSLGLNTRLVMSVGNVLPECDVLVVATDTRSMAREAAVSETRRIAEAVRGHGLMFKKTDSALRGNVEAELSELMTVAGYKRAVYLPANPSKGRTVENGIYYVGGVPIAETDFRRDPEFPALSSSLAERFPLMKPYCKDAVEGMLYADATSQDDISRMVAEAGSNTLLAGAADLFETLLHAKFPKAVAQAKPLPRINFGSDVLIVRGSTLSKQIELGIPVSAMPADVYFGHADAAQWQTDALKMYQEKHALIVSFGSNSGLADKPSAERLRNTMAGVAAALVAEHRPEELIIEGGATAYSLLSRLGWHNYTLTDQIAPGVVRMLSAQGTYVTLKPGSYPWGRLFGS